MSPDEINHFLADFQRTVPKCTRLGGGPSAYTYLRHLIAPASHWTLMLNPAKRDQLNSAS